MKPNVNAIQPRTSRPPFARMLSAPTYTMLSAIAGSLSRAGGVTMLSAASDSVRLWATEKQQAHEKQQVIRANEDVMDPGRNELPDDGRDTLTRPREVLEMRMARI